MTCPNRPGSKAGRPGAAPALRHDGGPQGGAGASPGRPPPVTRDSGAQAHPQARAPNRYYVPGRLASRRRGRRSQDRSPLQVSRSAAGCGLLKKQPSPLPPAHAYARPSLSPLPSTVTIPVPVPKAASAHGPKRIEIWERGTDGRAWEGLRLRSGDDRWRRRLRCWGGGRRGALSLRRAVSRRRRHRRRLSRRRREQNTENRGYKNSG